MTSAELTAAVEAKRAGTPQAPPQQVQPTAEPEGLARYFGTGEEPLVKTTDNPTWDDYVGNALAGASELPFALMDIPYALGEAQKWAGKKMGFSEEALKGVENPRFSRAPGINYIRHRATDPRIEPNSGFPVADAARTAGRWITPIPAGKITLASTAIDAGAAALAAGGEYLGNQFDTATGKIGEMVGGTSAYLAALLRGRTGMSKADKQATQFTDTLASDATGSIERGLQKGDRGTLADLAGSPSLYNAEHTIGKKGTEPRRQIDEMVAAEELAQKNKIADVFPSTDKELSRSAATEQGVNASNVYEKDRAATTASLLADKENKIAAALRGEKNIAEEISAGDAAAAKLQNEAMQAQGTVGHLPGTSVTNKAAHAEISRLAKDEKVKVKAAWDKFEAGEPLSLSRVATGLNQKINSLGLAKTNQAELMKTYSSEIKDIRGWEQGKVAPKDVQAVLSKMKEKIHASKDITGTMPYVHTQAGELVKYVEDGLGRSSAAFKEAKEATVAYHAKVKPGNVGKVRANDSTETYVDRLGLTGNQGATTARYAKASGDPKYIEAIHNNIRAEANQLADKGVSNEFMQKYKGYFEEFPALGKEMQVIADKNLAAKEGIASLTKKKTALTKALEQSGALRASVETDLTRALSELNKATEGLKKNAANNNVGKFAEDAEGRVNTLITAGQNTKATKELTELHDWAKKADVADSFKGMVKGEVLKKLFPEKEGLSRATGKSIDAFDATKQRFIDSGVLTHAEVKSIDDALAQSVGRQRARKAAGEIEINPSITPTESAAASGAALAVVASTGMPHALIATSFTKKAIVEAIKAMKLSEKAQRKVAEFLVNPEQYLTAHKMLKDAYAAGGRVSQERAKDIFRAVVTGVNATKE